MYICFYQSVLKENPKRTRKKKAFIVFDFSYFCLHSGKPGAVWMNSELALLTKINVFQTN